MAYRLFGARLKGVTPNFCLKASLESVWEDNKPCTLLPHELETVTQNERYLKVLKVAHENLLGMAFKNHA
jgi:hypothetical protein